MDVEQLKTFVTLAETRNTSRTAALLFLSQPAVTNRLRVLERELGCVLAEHAGKEMHLTEKGKAFLPYATQVLRVVEEGMSMLRAHGDSGPNLRVAASPLPSMYILPRILHSQKARSPEMCVHIRTNHQREVFSEVLDSAADVGLVGVNFRHPAIESVKVYEDEVSLVASYDHELASKALVRPSDLAHTNVVWFDRDAVASFWRELEDELLRAGLDAKRNAIWVDNAEAAKSVAKSGYGVAFLPSLAIASELRDRTFTTLHAPWLPRIKYEVFVIYKKARQATPLIREFLDLIGGSVHGEKPVAKRPPVVLQRIWADGETKELAN